MVKIDKGVPMPPAFHYLRRKYPLADMEVGDSFFTAGAKTNFFGSYTSRHKKFGKKFTTRAVVEDGVTGVRVWRVE